MPLPEENVTYVKINETQFYRASTSSTMIDVAALMQELASYQAQIDKIVELLKGGVDQGVSAATDAIIIIGSSPLSTKLPK